MSDEKIVSHSIKSAFQRYHLTHLSPMWEKTTTKINFFCLHTNISCFFRYFIYSENRLTLYSIWVKYKRQNIVETWNSHDEMCILYMKHENPIQNVIKCLFIYFFPLTYFSVVVIFLFTFRFDRKEEPDVWCRRRAFLFCF